MTKNENNAKRIFDKHTKSWFDITPEQYKNYDRWRTNLRKREQYHHRCMCPRSKWWLCDAMCQDCEFHAPGDTYSLDMPVANKDGHELTLSDVLEDPTPSIEDIICDKAELDKLFERLEELMPDAIRIGQLRQEGLSDAAIADVIGVKRTTFLSRIKKVKEQLSREYPELL